MTPEAQRVAIAEACPDKFVISSEGFQMAIGNPESDNYGWIYTDPLTDLNAMHEAEKVLTVAQWSSYIDNLSLILGVTGDTEAYCVVRSTAAQRAEAFLRVKGKWEDDK